MGTVLIDETGNAVHKLLEIREKCTLSVKSGLTLEYDKNRKVIVSAENTTERAEVFVVLEHRPMLMKVIVPFFTAREMLPIPLMPRCKVPVPFVFKATLREYQEKDSVKIINQLERIGSCYFQAYPGYGKTVMMAFMIYYFKLRAIIVVPSLTLVEQTVSAMKLYLPEANVFVMGTDRVIPDGVDIVICYRGRLNGVSSSLMPFEFLILDEVHMLSTHIGLAGMLTCRPTKVLALTATPGERNNITEKFVGPCEIESLSDKTWHICFPRIFSGLNSADYKGVNGYTEAINALSSCPVYIQSILNMVFYFRRMNQRIIIITMRTDLRDHLQEIIMEMDPSIIVGVLGTDSRKCGNCDIIIGTHKFIGTGFDPANAIENFDNKPFGVVVVCASLKNVTLMYQIAGRSFRNNQYCLAVFPRIADLDVSNSHTNQLQRTVDSMEGCIRLDAFGRFLERFAVHLDNRKSQPAKAIGSASVKPVASQANPVASARPAALLSKIYRRPAGKPSTRAG